MAEYSRIARGSFVTAASPVSQFVPLPFQPTSVMLTNLTAYNTPAQYAVTRAFWDIAAGNGTASIEYLESASAPWIIAADSVATGGISQFAQGLSLQFGPQQQIASIAKATPTVVVTASAHGYSVGDYVLLQGLYQSATTGMAQIAGIPFQITAVGSTTEFTITWNTNQSNYTALSGSPAGAFVMKILNPALYLPAVDFVSAINTSNGLITTTTNHNFVVGQEVAFRIPSAFGTTQLNSLPNNSIPGSPVYYYVSVVNSNTTFTISPIPVGLTAFNTNLVFSAIPGESFAQVVPVGDVNSGGVAFSGGALYPSPTFPTFSGGVGTINGPAISGAFVNNTRQGFSVGLGVGAVQPSALLLTASSTYTWEAKFFDFG